MRLPHCQRCAQHKIRNRLRGHKSMCQFRDCQCAKCLIVVEKQRLMAVGLNDSINATKIFRTKSNWEDNRENNVICIKSKRPSNKQHPEQRSLKKNQVTFLLTLSVFQLNIRTNKSPHNYTIPSLLTFRSTNTQPFVSSTLLHWSTIFIFVWTSNTIQQLLAIFPFLYECSRSLYSKL